MASSYRIKGTVLVEEATTNYLGVDNSVLDLGLVVTASLDPGHQQKLSPMQVLLSPRKFPN